jgi:hypothetical protein
MAIYDIFDVEKSEQRKVPIEKLQVPHLNEHSTEESQVSDSKGFSFNQLFSSVAARLFFLLLFIADCCWGLYAFLCFLCASALTIVTFGKISFFKNSLFKAYVSIKRSLVCGLSLIVALFSPAFGIMIACTYFLMYDKAGLEEVVPSSLQAQFKDLFKAN